MTWLDRLKNSNVLPKGTAKTAKRPARPLLTVLSAAMPGTLESNESALPRTVLHFHLRGPKSNAWATARAAWRVGRRPARRHSDALAGRRGSAVSRRSSWPQSAVTPACFGKGSVSQNRYIYGD